VFIISGQIDGQDDIFISLVGDKCFLLIIKDIEVPTKLERLQRTLYFAINEGIPWIHTIEFAIIRN
jgi:hypothetical protein